MFSHSASSSVACSIFFGFCQVNLTGQSAVDAFGDSGIVMSLQLNEYGPDYFPGGRMYAEARLHNQWAKQGNLFTPSSFGGGGVVPSMLESSPLRVVMDDSSFEEPPRTELLPSEVTAIAVTIAVVVLTTLLLLVIWARRRTKRKYALQAMPLDDYILASDKGKRS